MLVNEIFYSLQGEGRYTGTPSVFVRLSGCNLKCDFCDTEHQTFTEMTEQQICDAVIQYPTRHVVITGGEPAMQLTDTLIQLLHTHGRFIQVETNGTLPLPDGIDWITCSPKYKDVRITRIDELKVVFQNQDMSQYNHLPPAMEYYLQPCDRQDEVLNKQNINDTINFVKENPRWKLSLQTQKILNVQ